MAGETELEKQVLDEGQKLDAELARLKNEGEQPKPPEEAKAAEPIPPAETITPPVEAKSEPPPTPKPDEQPPKRDGAAWKLLRQRERELDEARAELARRQAASEPPKEPDFENQPADYLKARIERTEAELAQVKAEESRRNYIDNIKQQEQVFSKDHPDYYDATSYLIANDIKEWERTGASAVQTNQILAAARSADPQYAGYKRHITNLANRNDVIEYAEKENRDPEEVAAYLTARDSWLSARRDLIAEGAKATGRSTAEIAYEIAKERGFGNGTKASADEAAARARVQQSKEVSAATHSLSDSATAEAAQEVRVLKNRQQVLDLDDATLDSLIASGKYRELN